MIENIPKIFKSIFFRKHIREIGFISGTITWRECFIILTSLLLKRKSLIKGEDIKKYEEKFTEYLGVKYSFSFGAGRMALYAILKAMGIKHGDEVILPGYTCIVVPNAVIYCGARPIYVDIDPNTLNIDVNKMEEKISSRTKAIIAQHTFACFCDMVTLANIAKKYNLKIIEDCAHALGAEYKGRKAGTFGDAAYFTSEQSKITSTGMGGMAVANDRELADKLRDIQNKTEFLEQKTIEKIVLQIVLYNIFGHPFTYFIGKYILYFLNKLNCFIQSTTKEEKEGKKPERYPLRLSNIQAKLGLSQLRNIDNNLEHRRKVSSFYRDLLEKVGYKINENSDKFYKPSYIRYWFLAEDRERMKELFRKNQIELGEWFNCPIHPEGSYLKNVFYQIGSCPIAEYVAKHNVNLPTHLKVKVKDVNWISKIISKIPKQGLML